MEQRLALICESTDGIVTIAEGQVPVLRASSPDGQQDIPMAVNFLRSGCPAVQMVYINMKQFIDEVETLLHDLELPGEQFVLRRKLVGVTPTSPYGYHILTINRRTERH